MRVVILLVLLGTALSQAIAGELHTITSLTDPAYLERADGSGKASVAARAYTVSVSYPSGKIDKSSIVVLYDALSQFYLSLLLKGPHGAPGGQRLLDGLKYGSAVAISKDRMVWFVLGGPTLNLVESDTKSANLDQACESSFREIEHNLSWLETGEGLQYKRIPIGKQLASMAAKVNENFLLPWFPTKQLLPVHMSIVNKNSKWEITIAANLIAKVVLDSGYKVLTVEQIPGVGPAAAFGDKTVFRTSRVHP